ncbi:MAG: spermidine/putrescine ABC transporter substrate-binding protein, partial [Lachnospiraceae bacterium]|nr:spermidine/putrescine ABC transporter substrate-binding protein [Lachnospiraceae bacterium]
MRKTKGFFAVLMAMALVAVSLSGCKGSGGESEKKEKSDPGELNIYTWAEYVPQDVIDRFESETGIRVNYTNFEANEEMLAKLETSEGGEYDIIIASDYIIKIAAEEGLVKELDKEKMGLFI